MGTMTTLAPCPVRISTASFKRIGTPTVMPLAAVRNSSAMTTRTRISTRSFGHR